MSQLHLLSPVGFRAAGVYAGIKSRRANDVGVLVCDTIATAAAVFTTNKVFAAPVKIGREHVRSGKLRAIIVNSGNANACTGERGERDALRMCSLTAELVGCRAKDVLPSSTGVIGHFLPMEKVESGIRDAAGGMGTSRDYALAFGDAILTTDTKRKAASAVVRVGKNVVTLAGVCKGSGMIGPRMSLDGVPAGTHGGAAGFGDGARRGKRALHATMLAYLTTDAAVSAPVLRKLLASASDASFNAVTVDDHTSTNDTAVILASGTSGASIASRGDAAKFAAALDEVCQSLAYQIAADGEGATKTVVVKVRGAATGSRGAGGTQAAMSMARAIANSPLVKCAMHGNDPNWGRIVSAAGLAGVPFDPERCVLTLAGTVVFRAGRPVAFDPGKVSAALAAKEVVVDLDCRMGSGAATVWTCDLSKEYVSINADYHT